jgi:hypothetical protein
VEIPDAAATATATATSVPVAHGVPVSPGVRVRVPPSVWNCLGKDQHTGVILPC